MKIVIDPLRTPRLEVFAGNYQLKAIKGYTWECRDPIDYLIESEVENPCAFWGEDARDYALEGMIDGYVPRCKIARCALSAPRAPLTRYEGIAV